MLYAYFFLGKAKPWNPECRLIALLQMKQREAKRFAYSIILTGSETTEALELFALNDIQFCSQKVICRLQKDFQKKKQFHQSIKTNQQNNRARNYGQAYGHVLGKNEKK